MARMSAGILSAFSGKVGTVIGSSRKGVPYMKSIHKNRTKKISKKEKANRQRFKMAQEWLTPLVDFVRLGFKGYSQTVEGFIAAKSYLMKNAMDADGNIDPARMQVSFGSLSNSDNIKVKATPEGHLQFTWDTGPVKEGFARDQIIVLAYNIKKNAAFWNLAGEFRETGSDILKLSYPKGYSCHVYLAFVASDRSRQSHSAYLGEVKF
jgi:hypothetical protein